MKLRDGDNGQFCTTHGESDPPTPEYEAWHQIKSRCLNPNTACFEDYGGRGVGICSRWLEYANFLEDVGRRPSPAHSIDRIDNNGDYEPGNCRWSTRSEQQLNKRVGIMVKTNTSGVPGVSWYSQTKRWEAYHWDHNRKVRLGYFAEFENAVAARKRWEREHERKRT